MNTKFIAWLRDYVVLTKLRVQRGYAYFATLGVPLLVARELQSIFPSFNWIIFFVTATFIIWFMGWLDTEKGFYAYELDFSMKKNPEWMKKTKKWEEKK